MSIEFKLPDLGEGIHEAEVLSVKVKEGDPVKEDQGIFEVETDKAVVEIPCPVSGTVTKIHVKAGQTVTVGSVMMTFESAAVPAAAKAVAAQTQAASPVKQAVAAASTHTSPAKPAAPAPVPGNGRAQSAAPVENGRPVPAAPATRRLARELGIDLRSVRGSGPSGRVLKEDVRSFAAGSLESSMAASPLNREATSPAEQKAAPSLATKYGEGGEKSQTSQVSQPLSGFAGTTQPLQLPDFTKYGPVERIPLRSIRRKIAENMARSWAHIPHVTHFDEADVTLLEDFRVKHEKSVKEQGGRLTLTVFALKAIASGLKKYPQFNASLDEASGELVFKHYYNIGVAVATERGLIVPVIKNVDQKSFTELSRELGEISERTRSGKIELDRLQGGTFTLTNIGAIGGISMVPMVNHPECAILGLAKATQKPVVKEGKIEIGLIMPMALSFDHRIADGAEAAYFVRHIVQRLQDPLTFLLES